MFTLKGFTRTASASLIIGLAFTAPLQATTIVDNYVGANDHGYGDVIGSSAYFDIRSMDVSVSGTMLTVSINTNFAGRGDDGLYSGLSNGQGIGYGDLFLGSSWTPFGSAPYAGDQASNGTVWSYGFSVDNRWMNENSAGSGTLYRLNSGNNATDTLYSNHFMSGGIYRNGQEVAVNRNGGVTALANTGSWNINTSDSTVNFSLDLAGTGLLGSDIAVRWGMTCANDVIEGSVPAVPVPAAAWLFASGLLGMVGVARRKTA